VDDLIGLLVAVLDQDEVLVKALLLEKFSSTMECGIFKEELL
jgi:hypothetical protein